MHCTLDNMYLIVTNIEFKFFTLNFARYIENRIGFFTTIPAFEVFLVC